MLLFADGFDAYGATADLTKKWSSNPTNNIAWGATNGRFGGGGLALPATISTINVLTSPVLRAIGNTDLNFAFWFKCASPPAGGNGWFIRGIGSFYLAIGLAATGALALWGANSGQVTTNGFINVCDGQWHWIEIHFNHGANNALAATWVDGSVDISSRAQGGSNADTLIVNFVVGVGNQNAGATIYLDDLLCWDNQTGLQTGELNNASMPIGPQKCETMWPSGAGTNTHWSPDSGSNYARVNENPTDWDTSYVQASSSGLRDSYAFPGTISGVNPLVAVVNCVAKNADAGSINIQGLTYSGSSYGLGDSKLAGSAYLTTQFPIFRDPNTSAAWTKAGVNAAQFGVGVV